MILWLVLKPQTRIVIYVMYYVLAKAVGLPQCLSLGLLVVSPEKAFCLLESLRQLISVCCYSNSKLWSATKSKTATLAKKELRTIAVLYK